ncbi:hypothetical protein MLD52_10340 [Puniceicoccaceae bacterium K14]|nr:hypothetical protein [Puniceicoccaceae bacterium K14]
MDKERCRYEGKLNIVGRQQDMKEERVLFSVRLILLCVASIVLGEGVSGEATERVYLSGLGPADAVEWEFMVSDGRRSGEWSTIPVPSHWEQHGFGEYNYGQEKEKYSESGFYRTSFHAPSIWKGKTIKLVFEGAMTDAAARVNGKSAGAVHQGSFYRFGYDISELLTYGEGNVLEVDISKVSENKSLEIGERKADYWVFGGIYRPVYLEILPAEYIERLAIDAKGDGALESWVFLSEIQESDRIVAHVETLAGKRISKPFEANIESGGKVVLKGQVDSPLQWTAETPNLYRLRVQLYRGDEVCHEVTERFGFRTIEFRKGDGFYINGSRIVFKGVNRHSFRPEHGRALDVSDCLEDALAIKNMNANAVRCAHYPPRKEFLDYCDEVGLYVMNEFCTWQKPSIDTEVAEKLVRELVIRDVNHPSVFAWANGNEGGWNTEVDDDFALHDPQGRLVVHPWALFRGLNTDHYEPYASHVKLLEGPDVFLPTEFLHGLYDGGHGAGLADYWEAVKTSPYGAGGFLWCWGDEGLVRTDEGGKIDTYGNYAPDGIVGPHGQREASYYTIRSIWSPVRVTDIDFSGDVHLYLENDYDIVSLDSHTFGWRLVDYPFLDAPKQGETRVIASGSGGCSITAGESAWIKLGLPSGHEECDALEFSIRDFNGMEIYTKTWPLRDYSSKAWKDSAERVRHSRDGALLRFESGEASIAFSAESGWISEMVVNGHPISFRNGPTVVYSGRESGDSDSTSAQVRVRRSEVGYEIDVERMTSRFTWKVLPGGVVDLEYEFDLPEGEYQYYGVGFDLAEKTVVSKQWLGAGPTRVWSNRMIGPEYGYWENEYNDGVPGFRWDLPAFKGVFRDVEWMKLNLSQGVTLALEPLEGPGLLGVLRPENGPEARRAVFDYPVEGGLFVFHRAPAIGTKFNTPDQLGPESQSEERGGTVSGSVRFRFW